jgi:glycosyltransferase involved in cell wall biosynthesis
LNKDYLTGLTINNWLLAMNQQPLVSAIAIFLNEAEFLPAAIESVVAQTYNNWELLLVDDGSTDGSSAIALQFAQQYPDKIRYLEHPNHQNRGMSASRNLGINQAKGKYIAHLDGDDVWVASKLKEQVQIIESHPEAAMVYGPLRRWYTWNNNREDACREDFFGFGKDGIHPYADSLVEAPNILTLFLEDEFFIPGGILIKKEIVQQVGCGEEDFRGMYEDTVVLAKVCLNYPVYVSSQSWYKYRMHPDSCTHVSWLKGEDNAAQIAYTNWVENYLTQQGVKDEKIWQALRTNQWRINHPRLYFWQVKITNPVSTAKEIVLFVGRKIFPNFLRQQLKQQWQRFKTSFQAQNRKINS